MGESGYPESYYAATAPLGPSKPPLKGEFHCDVCVIGGGFSGLSTAYHLLCRGYKVGLLEAHRIGWGASGRNGGQAIPGLRKGAGALIAKYGESTARRIWSIALDGRTLLQQLIGDLSIDCDYRQGTLYAAYKPGDLQEMIADTELARRVMGYEHSQYLSAEAVHGLIATPLYHGGILDEGGAHLHPLKLALGLARGACARGLHLFEESEVVALKRRGGSVTVITGQGKVHAHYAVICCNGYLDRLDRRLARRIMPIGTYMIATEPLGEARAKALMGRNLAVSDSKFVLDYYRLSLDHRLLFGGGETYAKGIAQDIAGIVRPAMLRVFPQLQDCAIDYAWGGRIAITPSRLPDLGRVAPNIFYAQGFSGHGVILTLLFGQLIGEAIAGTLERFDVISGLKVPEFPGGTLLRRPLHLAAMLYFALRDRL